MPTKITIDTINKIRDLKLTHMTDQQIATALGTKLSTTRYWIRRLKQAGTKFPKYVPLGRKPVDLTSHDLPNPTIPQ